MFKINLDIVTRFSILVPCLDQSIFRWQKIRSAAVISFSDSVKANHVNITLLTVIMIGKLGNEAKNTFLSE